MRKNVEILNSKFYHGPNLHHSSAGIFITLNSGKNTTPELHDEPSREEILDVLKLLREAFPAVSELPDQSLSELIRQSDTPAITLFLTLIPLMTDPFSSQSETGFICQTEPQTTHLFVPCDNEAIGMAACQLSLNIINTTPAIKAGNSEQLRHSFRDIHATFFSYCRQHGLNQSTIALVRAARRRNIPFKRLLDIGQIVQLGQGVLRTRIAETATSDTNIISMMIEKDKLRTSTMLRHYQLPSTGTRNVSSPAQGLKIAKKMGFPVVVKPRTSGKGKGVSVNIQTLSELETALKVAARYKQGIIIEHYIPGDDHRLLVVNGQLVAAARRLPAMVIGDGASSVAELVREENADPRRGNGFDKVLVKIEIDQEALDYLQRAGLTPASVPAAGTKVVLRGTANISRGGTSIDVTDDVHPENRLMVERAARTIGINVAGVDFQTPDITKSWNEVPCAILEINSSPGLRPHLSANPHRDVAGPIVEMMFPDNSNGRVPTVGVTGSLGKTTTCHLITHILTEAGKQVALTTTQGAWIGSEKIMDTEQSGGRPAARMLDDPSVEAGVFEFARGGLIKNGLILDEIDVGVFLNVHDNHLGLDEIETREEMARVKQIVVQQARKLAVLNADDPLCLDAQKCITAPRICLVSQVSDNPALLSHQRKGGMVAYLETHQSDSELTLWEGHHCIGKMPAQSLPDSWNGLFRPALANALFAMAAAHGLGLEFNLIRTALAKFRSDIETNTGRNNFYQNLPYSLLISHADGPYAMQEVAHFADHLDITGSKNVILCSAGDRPDEFIKAMARAIAGHFSRYTCTNYYDLRGRQPDVVPHLLAQELEKHGVPRDQIQIELSSEDAVSSAYQSLQADDLIVDNTYSSSCTPEWLEQRGLTKSSLS